jgi:phage-related minor tail protein
MEASLDNFVRTGKLSFAGLAKSIIQDLIAIQIKAQAVSMFKGLGGFFGLAAGSASGATSATPGAGGYATSGMQFADGGSPPTGMASLVGERGPELFVPKTSGTIIPNNMLSSSLGGTTNVTNNYINAIDTKSFEQRLLGSSNTIWAANQYANKSLAAVGGRS